MKKIMKENKKDKSAPSGKKTGRKEILLVFAGVLLIAVILTAVYLVMKVSSQKKVQGQGLQYFGGAVHVLEEGTVLSKGQDGKTVAEKSGGRSEITELPIYYDGSRQFTITEDMIYYTPRDIEYRRVDHFTDLYVGENDDVHAIVGGKDIGLPRGFLFNGKNMYIFLESVALNANGHDWMLPPLSYVETGKSNISNVFNFETKEFIRIDSSDEIKVTVAENDYSVYLKSDTLETSDGVKHLLYTRPDLLDPIK